jgi:uncharacterized protein YbjT (DUF2867 family)
VLAAGIPYTFLRASFFMQNFSTIHRNEIQARGEIAVPAGDGKTSFIDVRDIADVALLALTGEGHANRAYTLTGGEALSYDEVADVFTRTLAKPVVYSRPSVLRFVRNWRAAGKPWAEVLVMTGIFTTARLGLAAGLTPDTAQLLGHAPTTLAEFVRDYREKWI